MQTTLPAGLVKITWRIYLEGGGLHQHEEDDDGHNRSRNAVGAKERYPDRDVVAAQGERHGKGRDAAALVLLAGLFAMARRVDRKAEGRNAEHSHPTQWHRCEQRADTARQRD